MLLDGFPEDLPETPGKVCHDQARFLTNDTLRERFVIPDVSTTDLQGMS